MTIVYLTVIIERQTQISIQYNNGGRNNYELFN